MHQDARKRALLVTTTCNLSFNVGEPPKSRTKKYQCIQRMHTLWIKTRPHMKAIHVTNLGGDASTWCSNILEHRQGLCWHWVCCLCLTCCQQSIFQYYNVTWTITQWSLYLSSMWILHCWPRGLFCDKVWAWWIEGVCRALQHDMHTSLVHCKVNTVNEPVLGTAVLVALKRAATAAAASAGVAATTDAVAAAVLGMLG